MSDAALDRAVDEAALLLNVNGFVDDQERVLARVPLRAYLDIDPGFGQMWRALDLHDPFAGHDAFVTIGERIGQPDCTIPTCGLDWITTPQPVVLERVAGAAAGDAGAPRLHLRRELARARSRRSSTRASPTGCACTSSAASPSCRAARPSALEVALDIHEAETADLELLRSNGWHLVDPAVVAADPWAYRDYVQRSKGGADDREEHVRRRAAAAGSAIAASATSPAAGRWWRRTPGISELYPVGRGPARLRRPRTRPRRALEDVSRRLRAPLAALRAHSPRSTSTRSRCCGGCCDELGIP